MSGDGAMRFQIQGTVATADLHGVYQQDAKDLLSGWLNTAPASVTELPSLNPGETRLVLKK